MPPKTPVTRALLQAFLACPTAEPRPGHITMSGDNEHPFWSKRMLGWLEDMARSGRGHAAEFRSVHLVRQAREAGGGAPPCLCPDAGHRECGRPAVGPLLPLRLPQGARRRLALQALGLEHARMLYEAPHRLSECVEDMLDILGPGSGSGSWAGAELTKGPFENHQGVAANSRVGSSGCGAELIKQRGGVCVGVEAMPRPRERRPESEAQRVLISAAELPVKQGRRAGGADYRGKEGIGYIRCAGYRLRVAATVERPC